MRWFWRKSAERSARGGGIAARRARRLFFERCEPRELLTTATLTASADNTIFQDNTSGSDGAGPSIFAGVTAGRTGTFSPRRALIRFDIASANIPAGAQIDSVTLQLNDIKDSTASSSSDSFGLYFLQKSWGEGTSNSGLSGGRGVTASAGDATWTNSVVNPPAPWAAAGGDFNATASATTTISGQGLYQWTGAGLVNDVKTWLASPGTPSNGWLLKAVDESTPATAREFESRQTTSQPAHPPTLTINYTVPNVAPAISGPSTASVAHGATLNFSGANAISVSDSDAGTSTESVTLAVAGGTLSLSGSGVSVTGNGTGNVTVSGTLANLNTALSTLSYTAPNSGTSATLTATASDGLASSNTLSTTISLNNVAPVVAGPTAASVAHGSSLAFTGSKLITLSDSDGGSGNESVALSVTSGTLTLTLSGTTISDGANGSLSVTISGTIANLNATLATLVYAAPNQGASANLSTTANDGTSSGNTLSTTVTLSNVAPTLAGPTSISTPRGSVFDFTGASTISISDIDAGSGNESVTLSVTSGTLAASGSNVIVTGSGSSSLTVSGTLSNVNAALAALSYTAPVTGTSATLTATANDGAANSNQLSVAITLTSPVNQPPTIDTISDVAYPEGSGQQTVNLTGITAGAGDSQALSLSVMSENTSLIDVVGINYTSPQSTGSLTFTPKDGQTGTSKITVTVHDAGLNGTLGDGDDGQTSVSFTVQVLSPDEINHVPSFTIAKGDQSGTDEDGVHSVAGWATDISAGPSQESTQQVNFLVSTDDDPLHPLLAAVPAVNSTGTLTFTPAPNAHGVVHVSVRIHDSGGTAAGGVDTSDKQSFAITITKPHRWHNTANELDVDGDKVIAPKDVVAVINRLNGFGAGEVPANAPFGPDYLDVDNDGVVAPKDVVEVIEFLNRHGAGEGEPAIQATAADAVLAQFDPLASADNPLNIKRRAS